MRIVYFYNFAPLSWEKDGKMHGIFIDVLNEALGKRMGIRLSHSGYPWKRSQGLVRNDNADAFITVPTPERRSYTKISRQPVVLEIFRMYVKIDHPKLALFKNINSIDELRQFKLGNYLGNGWAQTNLSGMRVEWAAKLDDTLKMLALGRFDIFVGITTVARFNIKKLDLTNKIKELPNEIDINSLNLCVRKNSPYVYLIEPFDDAMVQMMKDGTLQKIYDEYK